ncbi:MAG: sensor histidine kinase [Bacteroidales bacterium]
MPVNINVKGIRKTGLANLMQFMLANLVLAFIVVLAFMDNPFRSTSTFALAMTWAFAICITQWLGHGYIFNYLDKEISWIEKPVKRALWGLAALIVYSVIAFTFIQILFYFIVYGRLPATSPSWILGNILAPVAISFVITLTITAIEFFSSWRKSAVRAEKLNTELMTYKYEVLRNQINPHFLFNSFNVLSDLVYEDQDAAVEFIQKLSNLYRYVLDSREKEVVPLGEELQFVDSYLSLLKTRFENKLIIEIDAFARSDDYIVPVSIQMLIENAVKHNELSDAFPLTISIGRTENHIVVKNSLRKKSLIGAHSGTGLENLRQQFARFTNRDIKIMSTRDAFEVRLPVLKTETE